MALKIRRYALIFWLALVSAAYLNLYPPGEILKNLPAVKSLSVPVLAFAGPLAGLAVFFLSSLGFGWYFWRSAGLGKAEYLVFSFASGTGVLSLSMLLLNLFALALWPAVLLLAAAGLSLFAFGCARSAFRLPKPDISLAALAALPLLSALAGALAPPTLFDSLVYHLALPQKYAAAGRIFPVEDNFFFSFPQNMEMLYQAALTFNSDTLANLIHWAFFPATGLLVYLISRRYYAKNTALIASAFWFFCPSALFLATGTYVDIALAFFILLSLYCFLLWREEGKNNGMFALWAGVFGGLAMGVKYTAAAPVLITAVMLAVYSRKTKPVLLFAAAALAVFAPWLVKNAVLVHNPVSPWAAALFPASSVTAEQAGFYFSHIASHGMSLAGFLDIIMLPWNLTAYGFRYGGGFDIPGPLFLLFLPVLFLYWKIGKINKVLIIFSLAFGAFWLATGKVSRFILPVLPVLCILSAEAAARTFEDRAVKPVVFIALAAAMLHNLLLFHWVMRDVDPYAFVAGGESRDSYLSRKLNYYPALYLYVNNLRDGSKVAFLGETRSYYCLKDAAVSTVFDKNMLSTAANASAGRREMFSKLKGAGITHILENNYEYARLGSDRMFSAAGLALYAEFKKKYAFSVYKDPYCEVFELVAGDASEKK